MFDIGWPELMIVMIIALIVIGPKDLPAALRQLGKWVGAARRMSSEFQKHVDDIVRESELEDVKKGIDRVRNVNIKRELEKQIDPDGSLNKAFSGSIESKSSGAASAKSWNSTDKRPSTNEEPVALPSSSTRVETAPLDNSATADALTSATNKTVPRSASGAASGAASGGDGGSRDGRSGSTASGGPRQSPTYPSPGSNLSGSSASAKPAEPITTDQA